MLFRETFNLSLLLACLFLAGCSKEPMVDLPPAEVPPDRTVATVNGERLSLEEFDNEFRLMMIHYSAVSGGDMRAIKRRLFEQVIDRRIILQEARRAGLKLTRQEVEATFQESLQEQPEDLRSLLKARGVSEEAWRRKLLQERMARKLVDREVNSQGGLQEREIEDYYWSHLRDYWRPESIRALHLVVRKKAGLDLALKDLAQGMDFASVVAARSEGMEKDRGGDGGPLDLDRIPSAYRKALLRLKPGEMTGPLKDHYGFHLFQLVERRPLRMASYEEVKTEILEGLTKEERDLRFAQWMGDLKRRTSVAVNKDMALLVGVDLEAGRKDR